MKENYVYSLRICICPGFWEEEKFRELLEFCKKAGIDDVQFHLNSEEINQGHLSVEETKPWLAMMKRWKSQLEEAGVTVSLNPWTTTLHADRGRKLQEGQNFTTMVDLDGKQAQAVVCPKDENFRKYIKEIFGLYAETGFQVIWVEDDFRLHNHAPLNWGGCFCELHMQEFAQRAGKELTREEFVDGILSRGKPHPYRKIWLDTARDTMCEFAEIIGDAVHEKAPFTRIGLMSSAPEVHCVEGRDWKRILKKLAGETRPLNRPHLPAYDEPGARRYAIDFQKISRLSAAIIKNEAELWPELDNLPHTTFSKSHRFAQLEMESTLSLGAEGITINIFDMIGNGIQRCQKNEKLLSDIKPYLNEVKKLQLKACQEQGVCVMFSVTSAYTIHTNGERKMAAIQPCETFWAEYLAVFGIAYRYCDDISIEGEIVAVSGQYFRNLSQTEIEALFAKNTMLLDGEAAEVLVDMGLKELVQIEDCCWYKLNSGIHSFEQVADGKRYQGLPEARISAQGISETVETGDYLNIRYKTVPKEVKTLMKGPDQKTVGYGLVQVNQNVILFPYGHMREQYCFLLNPVRQEMLSDLLYKRKGVRQPVLVKKCQYVTVNDFSQKNRHILLLTNYSSDDFGDVEMLVPFEIQEAYEIARESGQQREIIYEKKADSVRLPIELKSMTSRCIIFQS